MCGPRPLPHPAQRQHPGLRPWRCQLQAGGRADAEPGLRGHHPHPLPGGPGPCGPAPGALPTHLCCCLCPCLQVLVRGGRAGVDRVPKLQRSTWGFEGPRRPHGGRGRGRGRRPGSQTPWPVSLRAAPQFLVNGFTLEASVVLTPPTNAPQRRHLPAGQWGLRGGSEGAADPQPPTTPPVPPA